MSWIQIIERHYPLYEDYMKRVQGFATCASLSDIISWYTWLEQYIEETKKQQIIAPEISDAPDD
jgi:hypothetical protein